MRVTPYNQFLITYNRTSSETSVLGPSPMLFNFREHNCHFRVQNKIVLGKNLVNVQYCVAVTLFLFLLLLTITNIHMVLVQEINFQNYINGL